jgi:hypothetical protein
VAIRLTDLDAADEAAQFGGDLVGCNLVGLSEGVDAEKHKARLEHEVAVLMGGSVAVYWARYNRAPTPDEIMRDVTAISDSARAMEVCSRLAIVQRIDCQQVFADMVAFTLKCLQDQRRWYLVELVASQLLHCSQMTFDEVVEIVVRN